MSFNGGLLFYKHTHTHLRHASHPRTQALKQILSLNFHANSMFIVRDAGD